MNVTRSGVLEGQLQPNPEIMAALEAQRKDSLPQSIFRQALSSTLYIFQTSG